MHAWVPVDGGRERGKGSFFFFLFVFTQKRDQTRISQMMNTSFFSFSFFPLHPIALLVDWFRLL